jgi:sirohydrochlorin ferrochelatase
MVTLNFLFQGIETEVIQSVHESGAEVTMTKYSIKTKATFRRWLKEHDEEWPESPLAGMSAGQKHMWLRLHRDTVKDCVKVLGKDVVEALFYLQTDTLEKVLAENEESPELDVKTEVRRLKAELCEVRESQDRVKLELDLLQDQRAENVRELRQLRQDYADFQLFVSQKVTEVIKSALTNSLLASVDTDRLVASRTQRLPPGG